jgi:tRNA nucleotidyltransferase/poly(A) polymerase
MTQLTEWLTKPLLEGIDLPIEIGDTVKMGRFKNKKVVVKSIDWNEKGDLLINGRPALKFRVVQKQQENISENKIVLRVPGDIKGLYRLFKKNKKQLYIVGGAVRDAILGTSPKDFDLATDAKPDEVLKIAKQGGFKTYEVGKSFGVVVVGGHEIATFRKDIGGGRRPSAVDFSDIQGDVNRRDLTINSLFYDIERNEVVDLTGGLKDLKAKIVKTVGNPKRRFDEDPLRKLRALRFQAVIGGKMDKETEIALMKNPNLKGVSYERIREEFVKAIQKGKSSKQFMESCDKFGFTKQIFPRLNITKPYPNVKDHILFLSLILRKNDVTKLGKLLNSLKYSAKESNNIQFLVYLNNFKPENIYMVKKAQEKTSLSAKQIIEYGKMIGKDLKKLASFKLSVKGGGQEFVGLKGKQIGDRIRDLEKKKFLGEIAVPSPSRKGINKNKTDRMSGYKKVEEILTEVDITPHHIQMLRTMYASVKMINPSGSAYKNLISYLDNMTRRNLQKISRAKIKWLSPLAKNRLKFAENLEKTLDLYSKNVVYSSMEDWDTTTISEQKIKRVVGIYGGRFQPFGPHHLKTFKWLQSKVDDAYIATSNIKKLPRHPMNFAEKARHMAKMGVPKNKIVLERIPLVAKNILKKYDPETTAVVYIFGKKDAGRLKGGKKTDGGLTYFQDFKKNKRNLKGHEEHGYYLVAPHVSMSVGGKEVSGTSMRNVLGSPKLDDKIRPKVFKKLFGYFNQGTYNMMTNKFSKLFEFYNKPSVKDIIKEVSALGAHFDAGILDDEGLYDFFNSFDDYKRVSPKHAEILGWEVIGDIVDYKRATDPAYDFQYVQDRVGTVTFGKTINQNTRNTDSVSNPFPKYKKHMQQMADKMGWEIIKFFGNNKHNKMKDSHTFDMKDVKKGVEKIKKLQDQIDITNDTKELLLMGGAYGHMSHPFDDNNLTFSDLKQIVINGLGGTLDREDGVTEKLDGQNLMVSWVDGKLRAARNKGHLKNFGKTAPTTSGIKSMFSGRGEIEKAFVGAMKNLEKAIGSLNDKQKDKVFGNGSKWMNLEVMYPKTANVVDYDIAEIVFHGTLEYDESGKPIGQPKDSARMLQGMIKQMNQHIQSMFRIGKPNFLTVPKHQDFGRMKNKFLGQLKKLQSQYALKDNSRLGEYHEAWWREYVFNASKQFKVSLKPNQFVSLVNRWAFFDKSYKIRDIKKDYKDNPKFLDWILSTDKMDHQNIFKQNIKPFEILFFGVGAEILKNISGWMAASPSATTQKLRKDVIKAFKDLQSGGNVNKLKKLKIQIEKLQAIGGLDAIVPSEGIVFKYKGKIYKFTGAFAPINQILGSLKFG